MKRITICLKILCVVYVLAAISFVIQVREVSALSYDISESDRLAFGVTRLRFFATDDAVIVFARPDVNYGSRESLGVVNMYGHRIHPVHWQHDVLVKFDISSLPKGLAITRARLYMYYYRMHDNNPAGRPLRIYRALSDWNENSVTWATQPSWAERPSGYSLVPHKTHEWMVWDVTADVQRFLAGTANNYGWKITDETRWGHFDIPRTFFRSKEYAEGKFHPYLEIIIEPEILALHAGD